MVTAIAAIAAGLFGLIIGFFIGCRSVYAQFRKGIKHGAIEDDGKVYRLTEITKD